MKFSQKLNTPAASSIWYTASSVISRGIGFLFTPIFTRLLSPTEYGIYSLYVSFMGIFTVLTTLEVSSVMYRGLAKFSDGREEDFTASVLGAQLTLTSLALIIYACLRHAVNVFTGLNTTLTLFLIIQVFFNSVTGIYFARQRYAYEYRRVSFINVAIGVMTPLFSLILIRAGYGGAPRIVSALIVSAAFVIPITVGVIKSSRKLFATDVWSFVFRSTLPMIPHYLSGSVIAQADKIIISHTLGTAAVGKYAVAYSVGIAITTATSGLSLALVPWMTRKLKQRQEKKITPTLTLCGSIACSAVLIFLCLLPEIFVLAVSEEYYDVMAAIYPISLSIVFSFMSGALTSCLLYCERPLLITRNSLISAAVAVVSGLILISRLGYVGGGISTLISYAVSFFLNLYTSKKLLGEELVEKRSGIINLAILFLFGILVFMLRRYFISRILILAAILLLALPNIKRCKRLVF